MDAVHPVATALTTMNALPSAKIIWSRQERFAMGIAEQVVKTIMPAPSIPPREIQLLVISNATIRLF